MKLKNIRKIYHNKHNDVEALKGINLELNEKGLIVLLGPSGCGKTTLLNIMSGSDTDFEGELCDIPQIEYLTQNFCLFENMSVIDNLLLVKEDLESIQELLDRFGLTQHQNKQVKLCSNGQKKRVQFIRALLNQPGMLLCDEPTAALDHDNAVLLMDDLKKVSQDIQVVLVTHDIALAEKYADRIIRFLEGTIIDEQIVKGYDEISLGEPVKRKTIKETFTVVLKELKSRKRESLLFITLSFITILALFSTFNLYHTISMQTDQMNAFNKGKNLIVSTPKDLGKKIETLIDDKGVAFEHPYRNFDVYDYQTINNAVNEYQSIIAVEAYYNENFYQFDNDKFIKYYLEIYPNVFNELNIPKNEIFVFPENMQEEMFEFEEDVREGKIEELEDGSITKIWVINERYHVSSFDLVNDYALPLLYGQLPQKNNEIAIDYNVAELLLKSDEKYKTIEDLVGKTIQIGTSSEKTELANLYNYADENVHAYEIFDVKITGISSIKNKKKNMIFFNHGFAKNSVMKYFVKNYDNLYFHYVNFLIDPTKDTQEAVKYLNENIPQDKNRIVKYLDVESKDEKIGYRNPGNFILFSMTITFIFSFMIFIVYLFIRKRLNKEQKILKNYGYDLYTERMMRIGLLNLVSFVMLLLIGPFICKSINKIAVSMRYESFIEFNLMYIFISFVSVYVLYFLYERILGGRDHD